MRTVRHFSLVVCMLSLVLHQASAQWIQTKGPSGGSMNLVWAQGSTLFAAADAGVYRSTDRGITWVDYALSTTRARSFIAVGTAILVGTDAGIYRTTDKGATWVRPTAALQTLHVNVFTMMGSNLYAGTNDGIYRSTDGGATWNSVAKFAGETVLALVVLPNAVGGTRLVAGCKVLDPFGEVTYGYNNTMTQRIYPDGNLYSSADEGATWKRHTYYTVGVSVGYGFGWTIGEPGQTLAVSSGRLFARIDNYGWMTSQNTYYLNFKTDIDLWQEAPDLGEQFLGQSGIVTSDLLLVDHDGFICRLDSTATDTTLQNNPSPAKLGFVGNQARSIARIPGGFGPRGDTLATAQGWFVATTDRGILQSFDGAKTWIDGNDGLVNSNVTALVCLGKSTTGSAAPIAAATNLLRGGLRRSFYGMYATTNQGALWNASTNGPEDTVTCLTTFPIGTNSVAIVAGSKSGLYSSTNNGLSWSRISATPVTGLATAFIQGKATLFAVGRQGGYMDVFTMTDVVAGQLTWVYRANPGGWYPPDNIYPRSACTSLDPGGNPVIYIFGDGGAKYSTDNGVSFGSLLQVSGGRVNAVVTAAEKTYIATNSGVYHGASVGAQGFGKWSMTLSGIKVNTLVACGSKVFAGTDSLGVFFSMDDGGTWYSVNSGLASGRIASFAYDGLNLYAGTNGAGVFRYTSPLGVDPSITPSASASVAYGSTFWVDVVAGNPDNVTDLWDFWFDLVSDNGQCTYVDSTGTYGSFIAQGVLPQIPRTITSSSDPTLVHYDIQRKTSSGVTGSGVVARAQFKAPPVPSGLFTDATEVTFSIKNFAGRNSKRERFYFHPSTFTVKFVKPWIVVWPGDCNADGIVNANDILPLGLYYLANDNTPDTPGIVWQSYNRQPWTLDDTPKRVHADANGDRTVNSADLLAVGLNYGKTHSLSGLGTGGGEAPALAKAESDGMLSVVSVRRDAGCLRADLRLSTAKPVYGIGFTLTYGVGGTSSGTLRFIEADTVQSVLGGGLVFSQQFDSDGRADIAITRVDKSDFTGDGTLLNVSFEAPAGAEEALRLEICRVVANDAKGNPVSISGSVYQHAVTGIGDEIPLRNELYQNYPNPFNPSTLIRFEVSSRASVSLKIFDVLGRELSILANGVLPAGRHSAIWDGKSLPSGVYFCVLRIEEENKPLFVQTRRMMLVK